MPFQTNIEILREQAKELNFFGQEDKQAFKDTFYKIENQLDIKGKANWRDTVNAEIDQLTSNEKKPQEKSKEKNNGFLQDNDDIDNQVANLRRYFLERTERENFCIENNFQKSQMEYTYKNLKKAYESHGWFAKWWGGIWPDDWTEAGRDFAALDEGKKILLDVGFKESEIENLDNEVLAELNPSPTKKSDEQEVVLNNKDLIKDKMDNLDDSIDSEGIIDYNIDSKKNNESVSEDEEEYDDKIKYNFTNEGVDEEKTSKIQQNLGESFISENAGSNNENEKEEQQTENNREYDEESISSESAL